uniref:Uncharacterized protein n=1 Tax=Rhizophora mucronata TaxID=61149 RepID=A0A2P2LIM2_RHIMU
MCPQIQLHKQVYFNVKALTLRARKDINKLKIVIIVTVWHRCQQSF